MLELGEFVISCLLFPAITTVITYRCISNYFLYHLTEDSKEKKRSLGSRAVSIDVHEYQQSGILPQVLVASSTRHNL